MPFTIAHTAIILPLYRNKRFSSTALFVGSMVPDFEFFFQLREVENIGHHWYGIIFFDLPVAFLLMYLFHGLLRDIFISYLPTSLKSRFNLAVGFNWFDYLYKNPITVFVSLIIGILSHMLLDGFTHHDGFFVSKMPFLLNRTGWSFLDIQFYFLLQLLFSLVGLIVILFAIYSMPRVSFRESMINKKYFWLSLILVMSSLLLIRVIGWPQYNSFGGIMIAVMGCAFYTWVIVSLLFFFLLKYQNYEH